MSWTEFAHWLNESAGVITSITILGGAFWWALQHFYLKPKEKRQKLEHKELVATIEKTSEPHVEILKSNERRIELLEKIAEQNSDLIRRNEEKLENHTERLVVLETHNGITKFGHVTEYKGENS